MSVTDHDLDRLLAAATPITNREVAALQLDSAEEALRDAIMRAGDATAKRPQWTSRARRERPRRLRSVIVASSLVGLAAAGTTIGVFRLGSGAQPAWAAEAIRVANEAPRLLLASDWRLADANEFTGPEGEVQFKRGRQEVSLNWRRGTDYAVYVADRARSSHWRRAITVLGRPASLFRYDDPTGRPTDDYTVLWRVGDHTLELRSIASSPAAFEALLGSLHEVDVDTWLSAMPENVVKPSGRAAAITAMLADIPIPPGVDVEALKTRTQIKDRYQLGAEVTGAVACAWLDRWLVAVHGGDTPAREAAETALAGSRRWAILLEMQAPGDWPEVLWGYADVATGAAAPPKGMTRVEYVAQTSTDGLGCG